MVCEIVLVRREVSRGVSFQRSHVRVHTILLHALPLPFVCAALVLHELFLFLLLFIFALTHMNSKASQSRSNTTVSLVVGFYLVVSIALVILNKIVLSHATLSIPAPFFVVWVQLVVSLACLVLVGKLGERFVPSINFMTPA